MPKCNHCGNTKYFEGMVLSLRNVKAQFNEYGDMIDVQVEPVEETLVTQLNGMAFENCSLCGSKDIQLDDLHEALDGTGRFHSQKSGDDIKEMIH